MRDYITQADSRRQKSALTRAINSGSPLKVLETVERTLREWDGKVWPDDWARWAVALYDAWLAYEREPARRGGCDEAERFWVLDSANNANRISEVSEAAQYPVVAIVDDEVGGVIAYAAAENAARIVRALEGASDIRNGNTFDETCLRFASVYRQFP